VKGSIGFFILALGGMLFGLITWADAILISAVVFFSTACILEELEAKKSADKLEKKE